MKILLDECVPSGLRRHLRPHNALTVAMAGWKGIKNGTLMTLASGAGFEAFVSTDRGYAHQQNISTLPLPVLILLGKKNDLPHLLPLVPKLIATLASPQPGVTT